MKRLATILTTALLLTACSGRLGSIAERNSVCISSLEKETAQVSVCDASSEAEDDSQEDTAPTLLTGFFLNR